MVRYGNDMEFIIQDEYEELLKYAVVVPEYDPSSIQQTLTDAKDSFYQKKNVLHFQGNGFPGNQGNPGSRGNTGSREGSVTPTRETLISVTRERDGMFPNNKLTMWFSQRSDGNFFL